MTKKEEKASPDSLVFTKKKDIQIRKETNMVKRKLNNEVNYNASTFSILGSH